ncbi:CoA transferase [Arthrobacter sp. I2-34]|uniref:CoA transferase n=1 Tax=Arthrobacter hankyongi TaxID=2904801 RepID=A0ABS9L3R4_9MICC|nr:CaiB/BaiF CoA-transferase family protein [Arthrobacter hankyongi]MCG2621246.1 CoA transferase [Arthrobacter hankyongi]
MGPLQGLKVLEIASAAPAPFACMMLADLGADVVRIDRPGTAEPSNGRPRPIDPLTRGRTSIELDLKEPSARDQVLQLVRGADVLVEGFRPGVAERLGLGPDDCLAANHRLVYGRMTGWGQSGPMAGKAGHDINYIALSGALEPIGRTGEPPVPPINMVGDYGGGGMLLAFGILAALYERRSSGTGQVVDAAMVDGSSLLAASIHGMIGSGTWRSERGTNLLDSGAPFYDVYQTADGGFLSVGALEKRFYAEFLAGLGLDPAGLPAQYDRKGWPELRSVFARCIKARSRDEWVEVFADLDACVAPVLAPPDAPHHPHARERAAFVHVDGIAQPAPAPRFSRTPAGVPNGTPVRNSAVVDVLSVWVPEVDHEQALR